MKLLGTLLTLLSIALQPDDVRRDDELAKLRDRAEAIIDETQSLEINLREARRKVQLLLKDLEAWAEDNDVELTERTRTYGEPAKDMDEPLTADRCPLFFEEELEELCPLDLARSEVWGGEVVFCRYRCAE